MSDITTTQIFTNVTKDTFDTQIRPLAQPAVLKGLASHWPAVEQCKNASSASTYLNSLYNRQPISAFLGGPETKGRFYYNEELTGFNFAQHQVSLSELLDRLVSFLDQEAPPALYSGSTPTNKILPDFTRQNTIPLLEDTIIPRIWIGNQTRISAHYDIPDNIACVVSGHRRFTLFPTDQLKNLYVGPLDFTPAGQSLSLVDFHNPDFEKYPRFKEALEHAQVAELEPGDAIYIPSLWWHHVEGLDAFNILVNYWWDDKPSYCASPFDTLLHSIISIKNLPNHQKEAWKAIFEHYIFNTEEDPMVHLPEHAKGVMGEMTFEQARKIRASLINALNR